MHIIPNKTYTLLASFLLLTQLAVADVTLCGSGSFGRMIKAQQTAIESASGQKLEVTTKNSALGVKDLVAGKANLAVVSGPAKAVYKAAGISDDVADKSGHGGRRTRAILAITADISQVITPISAIRFVSIAGTQRAVPPWTTKTPSGVAVPAWTLATVITVPPSAVR